MWMAAHWGLAVVCLVGLGYALAGLVRDVLEGDP